VSECLRGPTACPTLAGRGHAQPAPAESTPTRLEIISRTSPIRSDGHCDPYRGDVPACPAQRLDRRPLRQHPGRCARRGRSARRRPDRGTRPRTSLVALAIALALLGVGWNIGLLSGTTALAGALDPAPGHGPRAGSTWRSPSTAQSADFGSGLMVATSSYAVLLPSPEGCSASPPSPPPPSLNDAELPLPRLPPDGPPLRRPCSPRFSAPTLTVRGSLRRWRVGFAR
jgi:hypothetical protein